MVMAESACDPSRALSSVVLRGQLSSGELAGLCDAKRRRLSNRDGREEKPWWRRFQQWCPSLPQPSGGRPCFGALRGAWWQARRLTGSTVPGYRAAPVGHNIPAYPHIGCLSVLPDRISSRCTGGGDFIAGL